jgi:hypothetical protein
MSVFLKLSAIAEGQPAKAVIAQTCMDVFFIRLVPYTTFTLIFLPEPPADHSLIYTAL